MTLLAALYGGEGIWGIQFLMDFALVGYVVFLLETKRRRQERTVKVPTRAVRGARRREATY